MCLTGTEIDSNKNCDIRQIYGAKMISGAGFTKIDFDYGLAIVDSQTSDIHLNQTDAQSTKDSEYLK